MYSRLAALHEKLITCHIYKVRVLTDGINHRQTDRYTMTDGSLLYFASNNLVYFVIDTPPEYCKIIKQTLSLFFFFGVCVCVGGGGGGVQWALCSYRKEANHPPPLPPCYWNIASQKLLHTFHLHVIITLLRGFVT